MPRIYQPGELIDEQYRVEHRLQGGMSVVYIAVDTVTGKRFALKALDADEEVGDANREATHPDDTVLPPSPSQKLVARFEREATVWVNLDHHPNIVQAYAFLKQSDPPLLLLEYIDGPTLARVLSSGERLAPRQAVHWARQFCAGMHYVHTKQLPNGQVGTLHRDIKPGNILVTRSGTLKITDFGLVKLTDDRLASTTGFVGTVSYSSPEQLRSAHGVDRPGEVFSFGIVLYYMLTGAHPFPGDNVSEVMQSIQHREPNWSRLPPPFEPIVRRCLHKSPQPRYQHFAALDAALEKVERELAVDPSEAVCSACGFVGVEGDACVVCRTPQSGDVAASQVFSTNTPNPVFWSTAPAALEATVVFRCECGAPLESEIRYCRNCGRSRSLVQCSDCGNWNPSTNVFCNQCRNLLQARKDRTE